MLTEMKIEWRRGFFRAWMVLALAWVALVGWKERDQWSNGLSYVHSNGECWDRLAKWQDGKPFDDVYDLYNDTKDSSSEKDQWRDAVRLKINDCEAASEAAKPIMQRLTLTVSESWPILKESLSFIFLPPFALLIAAWVGS
jgi:hypothetical protein